MIGIETEKVPVLVFLEQQRQSPERLHGPLVRAGHLRAAVAVPLIGKAALAH
jgi:hypothetical protein